MKFSFSLNVLISLLFTGCAPDATSESTAAAAPIQKITLVPISEAIKSKIDDDRFFNPAQLTAEEALFLNLGLAYKNRSQEDFTRKLNSLFLAQNLDWDGMNEFERENGVSEANKIIIETSKNVSEMLGSKPIYFRKQEQQTLGKYNFSKNIYPMGSPPSQRRGSINCEIHSIEFDGFDKVKMPAKVKNPNNIAGPSYVDFGGLCRQSNRPLRGTTAYKLRVSKIDAEKLIDNNPDRKVNVERVLKSGPVKWGLYTGNLSTLPLKGERITVSNSVTGFTKTIEFSQEQSSKQITIRPVD